MPVMSILGCRIFEDEIVHLIENDSEVKEVLVVENEDCDGLIRKMAGVGISHVVLPLEKISEKLEGKGREGFILVVHMLELALHAVPENLKETVYLNVKHLALHSDGILLFYGLCGNVLRDLEKDLDGLGCPVRILKEENGEIVDDCIGAVLGGRGPYLETLKKCRGVGTFFLTPMWASNWREMMMVGGFCQDPEDIEMSKFVFESAGYKKLGKINTGLSYEKNFEEQVREFSELFDFEIEVLDGTLELVRNCYVKAKEETLRALN
ncbi:MAG: DUF1638 domain-containing protein [Methanosarcinaceae archaeon]|nr:DUF1638 domain-containing protein [Methanosarcinaceae archaeon]MDD4498379.1 DUF1638 domain-containing protein [Methanosarcinaceae archaeon]